MLGPGVAGTGNAGTLAACAWLELQPPHLQPMDGTHNTCQEPPPRSPQYSSDPHKDHCQLSHKFKLRGMLVSSSPPRGLFHISLCISCEEREQLQHKGALSATPSRVLPVQPSAHRKRGSTTFWRSPRALAFVPGERAVWLLQIWQRPSPTPKENRGPLGTCPNTLPADQHPQPSGPECKYRGHSGGGRILSTIERGSCSHKAFGLCLWYKGNPPLQKIGNCGVHAVRLS